MNKINIYKYGFLILIIINTNAVNDKCVKCGFLGVGLVVTGGIFISIRGLLRAAEINRKINFIMNYLN